MSLGQSHIEPRLSADGSSRIPARDRPGERGQALAEILVFTSFAVLLMLALLQLYLMGWTVQRSVSAGHSLLFGQASEHNCAEKRADDACTYDSDTRGKLIWSPRVLPEVQIPMFEVFAGEGVIEQRLWSNSPLNTRGDDPVDDAFERCQGRPCKRTKLTVGTWMPLEEALHTAGVRMPGLARPLLAGK